MLVCCFQAGHLPRGLRGGAPPPAHLAPFVAHAALPKRQQGVLLLRPYPRLRGSTWDHGQRSMWARDLGDQQAGQSTQLVGRMQAGGRPRR